VSSVSIEHVSTPTDELRTLIFELDSELAAAYTPVQMHGLTLNSLFAPHIRMFVARLDGVAVGCGGVAFFDGFAELKRMYVRAAQRGHGVAQALLAHLETVAREGGAPLLRLETGIRQPAAIRLYESAGFAPCAAFGDYATMSPAAVGLSLFYEKRLN